MRVVVALGGNALLRRGEPMTAENQRANVLAACVALAPLARDHELVIRHGNGPQVGLLALQGSAYKEVEPYPLDVLGAQTEGMIGYLIQQELGNQLPPEQHIASLLTLIEVDPDDPAFANRPNPSARSTTRTRPTHSRREGLDVQARRRQLPTGRAVAGAAADLRDRAVEWLLEQGCVVICAGGGGIPVMYSDEPAPAGRQLVGVEAVIDKDLASAMLAADLSADALLIVTDVDAVYTGWGTPEQHAIRRASPRELAELGLRRGIDGTEGARRLHLRREAPAALRRSARSTTLQPCCEARPERQSLSTRPRPGKEATMATVAPAPRQRRTTRSGSHCRARTSPVSWASTPMPDLRPTRQNGGLPSTARTHSSRPRASRAGTRSCASTATRCRSSCWSRASGASGRCMSSAPVSSCSS